MISCVDRADYEEFAGFLRGLLIRLDDRPPGKDVTLIAEFIEAGELMCGSWLEADSCSEAREYRFVTHGWMPRLTGPPTRAGSVEGREKAVIVKLTAPPS